MLLYTIFPIHSPVCRNVAYLAGFCPSLLPKRLVCKDVRVVKRSLCEALPTVGNEMIQARLKFTIPVKTIPKCMVQNTSRVCTTGPKLSLGLMKGPRQAASTNLQFSVFTSRWQSERKALRLLYSAFWKQRLTFAGRGGGGGQHLFRAP